MKKILSLTLLSATLLMAVTLAGCAPRFSDFAKDGDIMTMTRNGLTVTVDGSSGLVKSIASENDSLSMDGIFIDAGLGEKSLFEQIGYKDMSTLATYELPLLWAKRKELPAYTVDAITATKDGFDISLSYESYSLLYRYELLSNALALTVRLSTSDTELCPVNGVSFLVRGIKDFSLSEATFEFPGSTPAGKIPFLSKTKYKVTSADYSAPVVQLADSTKISNILYVNEVEKWTAGCYFDETDSPCVAFHAATEGYLSAESPMEIGTLYLPLRAPDQDPYSAVSAFWADCGYAVPADTSATDELCAIYSGHPFGTMDTGYFNRLTLGQYAEQLGDIAAMGFDAIWLLPVFQHTGDNVYEPIDEAIIDKRYGGFEEAVQYIEEAHKEGVKVLFDFVPHGPRPVYPFAKEHDDWISKDKNGNNQIEWECVSMDYNHPDYALYLKDLAAYYAKEAGLDGARIDCSMGGLPNWSSAAGLRASAAGLSAGVNAVKALREGFLSAGTQVLLLPENFHPSPAYAPYTDVFYDMPLYRCLFDLHHSDISETEYVSRLCSFLEAEGKVSVDGQLKLRFLGNHDTVTWTFDAQRAQTLYGTQRAKALWMAMGWIDGVLYIYQGDEDPATYHLDGRNLSSFFTELIAAKRNYLPTDYRTQYIQTDSPIMAFYRYGEPEEPARLVLINLSAAPQSYTLNAADTPLASIGEYSLSEGKITLSAWSGIILDSTFPE